MVVVFTGVAMVRQEGYWQKQKSLKGFARAVEQARSWRTDSDRDTPRGQSTKTARNNKTASRTLV